MKYIIEGRSVDKVLRENRIRISRGELVVTPFEEAAPEAPEVPETDSKETAAESDAKAAPEGEDNKEVTAETDSKDSQVADEKEPAQEEPKKSTRSTKK